VTRWILAVVLAACGSKAAAPEARIIDLSTSTAELQQDFDAHAGEARFVTLIAPT